MGDGWGDGAMGGMAGGWVGWGGMGGMVGGWVRWWGGCTQPSGHEVKARPGKKIGLKFYLGIVAARGSMHGCA